MNNKLTIDRILDFYDVPQLFIAKDAFDTTYLCLLYNDEPSCLYTAIRISNNRLQEFLNGEKDLRDLYNNPETPHEYFDVEYKDEDYFFEPYKVPSIEDERLPLPGYKMSGEEQEAILVRIPVKDRNLLKDIVRKFGWACVF